MYTVVASALQRIKQPHFETTNLEIFEEFCIEADTKF